MLNPDAIIAQALGGSIPDTWHVFRGTAKPIWLALLSGIAAFIAVCIILLALLLCLGPLSVLSWLISANSSISNQPQRTPHAVDYHQFSPLVQNLSIYFWILPIVCALVCIVIAYRRGQAFRHALLILTPEGVVQSHNYASQKHVFEVLDFEQIAAMTLHLRSNDDSSHAQVWLDIVRTDKTNATEQWPIDSRYGPVEQIIQIIIEDHALYAEHREEQAI
jgi:hypothetical protein